MKKLSMFAAIIAFGVTSMAHAEGGKVEVVTNTSSVATVSGCDTPDYPQIAFQNGEQGNVVLNVLVDKNGNILDTKTDKTSGYWNLDHASRHALSHCKFAPVKGQASWQKVGFNWIIET
jgi:protein TonB